MLSVKLAELMEMKRQEDALKEIQEEIDRIPGLCIEDGQIRQSGDRGRGSLGGQPTDSTPHLLRNSRDRRKASTQNGSKRSSPSTSRKHFLQ